MHCKYERARIQHMTPHAAMHILLRAYLPGSMVLRLDSDQGDFDTLPEAEQALVLRAVATRRVHFAAGRHLARTVLAELGHPVDALLRQANGAPDWPPGIRASLTHTTGLAGVLAGHSDRFAGIGLDIEQRAPFPLAASTIILTDNEREMASTALAQCRVFCAKEALYKCLSPLNAPDLDFRDVEIVWKTNGFSARAVSSLARNIGELGRVHGFCVHNATHVAAFAFIAI